MIMYRLVHLFLFHVLFFVFYINAFPAVSFQSAVKPILQKNCAGCHNPGNLSGQLNLMSFDDMMKGGKQAGFINTKEPANSLIIQYVVGDPPMMPIGGTPLTKEDVNTLLQWIKEGALNDSGLKESGDDGVMMYHAPPVISAMAYSPDGEHLAVSGSGEILLNKSDGSGLVARMPGRAERITSLTFSPDGKTLAAVGGSPWEFGEVQFWSVEHHTLLRSVKFTFDTLYGASFSPDGKLLGFGAADKKARIVTVPFGKLMVEFENHDNWVMDTLFTTNGKHMVSTGLDKALKLLEVETGAFVDDINSSNKGIEEILSIDRHPAKDQAVMGGIDGIPRIYKLYRTQKRDMPNTDFNLIRSFEKIVGGINVVRFSPDGSKIAAGAGRGKVHIYDVDSGKEEVQLFGDSVSTFALEYNPAKDEIAVGGLDGMVRIYHPKTGELIREFHPVEIEKQEVASN
jgi:hypothetical protein